MSAVSDRVMEHADAAVSDAEAQAIARELYGVEADPVRLAGERDQIFKLVVGGAPRFVLKLVNSAEDPSVTDLQTRLLVHVAAADPGLPVPRLVAATNGELQPGRATRGGGRTTVRLLTFLDGVPMAGAAADDRLLERAGATLARLGLAFAAFRHPAEDHPLEWDLQRASATRARLAFCADPEDVALAHHGLDLLEAARSSHPAGLRTQFIHNDFNPYNVLVDDKREAVTGVLDFGDAVRAPLVNDLAVAAAYHVREQGDPLEGVAALVRGFSRIRPLLAEEVERLAPLIAGRLAMTLAITAWRASLHPANRAYILRNAPAARLGLRRLLALAPDAATDAFARAGGLR